jgi:hypothetical protein
MGLGPTSIESLPYRTLFHPSKHPISPSQSQITANANARGIYCVNVLIRRSGVGVLLCSFFCWESE